MEEMNETNNANPTTKKDGNIIIGHRSKKSGTQYLIKNITEHDGEAI